VTVRVIDYGKTREARSIADWLARQPGFKVIRTIQKKQKRPHQSGYIAAWVAGLLCQENNNNDNWTKVDVSESCDSAVIREGNQLLFKNNRKIANSSYARMLYSDDVSELAEKVGCDNGVQMTISGLGLKEWIQERLIGEELWPAGLQVCLVGLFVGDPDDSEEEEIDQDDAEDVNHWIVVALKHH
jgi:hypothetical protein